MARATTRTSTTTIIRSITLPAETFAECVERHCAAENNPYVAAAREIVGSDDEHEIDEKTVVSESDDGAWVMSWIWVPKECITDHESTDSVTTA